MSKYTHIHLIDKDAMDEYLNFNMNRKEKNAFYKGCIFGVMIGASIVGFVDLLFIYFEVMT